MIKVFEIEVGTVYCPSEKHHHGATVAIKYGDASGPLVQLRLTDHGTASGALFTFTPDEAKALGDQLKWEADSAVLDPFEDNAPPE